MLGIIEALIGGLWNVTEMNSRREPQEEKCRNSFPWQGWFPERWQSQGFFLSAVYSCFRKKREGRRSNWGGGKRKGHSSPQVLSNRSSLGVEEGSHTLWFFIFWSDFYVWGFDYASIIVKCICPMYFWCQLLALSLWAIWLHISDLGHQFLPIAV